MVRGRLGGSLLRLALLRLRRRSAWLAELGLSLVSGSEAAARLGWREGADLGGALIPPSIGPAGDSPFGWRLRFGAFLSAEAGRLRASRPDMMEDIMESGAMWLQISSQARVTV